MKLKTILCFFLGLAICGCGLKSDRPERVALKINDYEITKNEFEDGFMQSAFADREDKARARAEYMETLISQKLILLDAQNRGIDKGQGFLKSVEKFWEQSLITEALGVKTREISKSLVISDIEIRRFYESMVKEGITKKPYEEVYPQIKRQAQKQMETRLLDQWLKDLRGRARIDVNKELLKKE